MSTQKKGKARKSPRVADLPRKTLDQKRAEQIKGGTVPGVNPKATGFNPKELGK